MASPGRGWHKEPRPHKVAALKGLKNKKGARAGKSTGGMHVTSWPLKRVKVGTKYYDIPTGPGGKVPQLALTTRFLNVEEGDRDGGKRNVVIDVNDYAKVTLPPNLTPEEASNWWAYPNESDIKGIDMPGNSIFSTFGVKGKGAQDANRSIAIVGATEEQAKKIREAISTGFTVKEQRKMGGTAIFVTDLAHAAGEYHGKAYGGNYLIMLDKRHGINSDTVVHELTHHLRAVDDARESPLVKYRAPYRGKDRDLEEAATVAETQARHKPYSFGGNMGYYGYFKEPLDAKAKDRGSFTEKDVVTGLKGQVVPERNPELILSGKKGKRAVRSVEKNFETSKIGHLNITGGKLEAIDQFYTIVGRNGQRQNVQRYSPGGVRALPRTRQGDKVIEWRDGTPHRVR